MRVIFLALEPPYPANDGGRIRTYNLLSAAARDHAVTFVSFQPAGADENQYRPIRDLCCAFHLLPRPMVGRPTSTERMRLLTARLPVASRLYDSAAMLCLLEKLTEAEPYDLVHIDHLFLARYANQFSGQARVLNHSDVEVRQQRRLLRNDRQRFTAYWALKWLEHLMWRSFETRCLAWFHAHLAVSDTEAAYFRRYAGDVPVVVVPNGVDTSRIQPNRRPADRPMMLYTGRMDYRPNSDAAVWFCRSILPAILAEVPDAHLMVVGREPADEVRALAALPAVTVTGTVPDVRPYYEQAAVAVVPLRAGGGTRLKILEAMAAGVPVVSTSIGCEGLDVEPGRHLLVADDEQGFARETIRLLKDAPTGRALSARARELAVARYDWESVGQRLLSAYQLAITHFHDAPATHSPAAPGRVARA